MHLPQRVPDLEEIGKQDLRGQDLGSSFADGGRVGLAQGTNPNTEKQKLKIYYLFTFSKKRYAKN